MNNIHEGKSNIIAACILSAGLVVASVIVAKPKISFQFASVFPPISLDSVKQQFATQMEAGMKGRYTDRDDGRRLRYQALEVGNVKYDAQAKRYFVEYTLYWQGRDSPTTGTGCSLETRDDSTYFSGSCNSGQRKEVDHSAAGAKIYQDETVTVNVNANQ